MSPYMAAVLLAAGESRRMGPVNKLLLEVDGEPLVRRTARVLLEGGVGDLLVVLGHEAPRLQPLLSDLPLRTGLNPRYPEGQMSSVHCGLSALGGRPEGILIALADQPTLQPRDVARLIRCYRERGHHTIVVPTHRGQRGNPIALDPGQREAILRGGRNLGCRRLIERCPERVKAVEMASPNYVIDLDTPEDRDFLQEAVS
ncbi:nucleotidyltransferase family protein [Alkalilimnicola ehrlichii MLHE-1]|uniref:Molybdenum cofactor cytidylyltransferase n=1 Tax=Alkalilimnicola ehrlichii (strain ATCC BAA-1101 / DSM 17681 / MLHE-1) TaxID=187272 RepID=Q0A8C2_ALKEH|nr:nucleotidyltransferase family protein [Alkalilimnicola ehrlichii]ABI56915.1 molybdenum cofactor cytidylyltransferase [Alkalilimnicola ehrlichii MLHE-1]